MDALSQPDIDRLLGGGAAAAPAAGAGDAEAEVQPYDFRRPHRVSKERLRTLEAMYERMVKALEGWLISRVRGQVELRLQSVEQYTFGEFVLSLPSPCASYVFDVRGAAAQGVVDVGHEFAYLLVERLFGGAAPSPTGAAPGAAPQRALSPVERLAVRTVAERACALLEEIWQDHVRLDLGVTGFESSPEILQVANREDPVLVANVEVLAGPASSLLMICLPFAVLEAFFQQSGPPRRVGAGGAGTDAARDAARAQAERALRATPVTVSARLPAFRLSLQELAALAPGQVLDTGVARDAELTVLVNGRARFAGSAGRLGRRLAVRLHGPAGPPPDAGDHE